MFIVIVKNNEIVEYCCDIIEFEKKYFDFCIPLKETEVHCEDVYNNDNYMFDINYCPFCGAKIEFVEWKENDGL